MDDRWRHSRFIVVAFLYNVTDTPLFIMKHGSRTQSLTFFPPAEPYFVQAVDYGDFIYFFYREIAMEYNTMGKVCIGRILLLLFLL